MPIARILGAALIGALLPVLAASAADQSQQPPAASAAKPPASGGANLAELAQRARKAKADGDYDAMIADLEKMKQLDPYDGRLTYALAEAYALKKDPKHAFGMLARLQQQGLAYDPRGDADFDNIKQYQLFDFLGEHLAANAEPFNKAGKAFATDAPLGLPDAIARDPGSGDFFLAGMKQGRILRVDADGKSSVFVEAGGKGPGAISALVVDAGHGVLWAAGTEVRLEGGRQVSVNARAAALYAFDLNSGKLEGRHAINEHGNNLPHLISEMAVAPDGDVYVTDRLSPVIYVLKAGGSELEPFLGSARLSSLQGLAIDAEAQYLYVADWVTGIYRIHLDSQHVQPLAVTPAVNLGGIRSMAYDDGALIAVQTGTRPERVVRYQLNDDRTAVVGQQPLSANQPEYDHPGPGILADDGFYFIANSGWGRLDQPPSNTDAVPVVVLKADPELGKDETPAPGARSPSAPAIEPGTVNNLPPGLEEAPESEEKQETKKEGGGG